MGDNIIRKTNGFQKFSENFLNDKLLELDLKNLYKIINDNEKKHSDLLRRKDELFMIFKEDIRTFKEDLRTFKEEMVSRRSITEITEEFITDKYIYIYYLQKDLNSIEDTCDDALTMYNNIIENPLYVNKDLIFNSLRNIYKDSYLYNSLYVYTHKYNRDIIDLEKELKEVESTFFVKYRRLEGGRVVAKYKSTGEYTHILYNNRKLKRCIYENIKGRGKYCKINNKYILLSKLKKYKLI